MRKGRFSKKEIAYIKDNCETLSHSQLAKELNRDPDSVGSFIKSKLVVTFNFICEFFS